MPLKDYELYYDKISRFTNQKDIEKLSEIELSGFIRMIAAKEVVEMLDDDLLMWMDKEINVSGEGRNGHGIKTKLAKLKVK